jgi:2-methylisocitrate lyase-like PEP mutase family enzyme
MKNFTLKDLENCGVARVSLPTLLLLSSIDGMEKALNMVINDEMYKI